MREGKDATILIHEATFEDDLMDHACHKRHSTVSEALTVGKSMNAKYTVLTHFSQRTRLFVPQYDAQAHPNVIIAHDHMRLWQNQLQQATNLGDIFKLVYNAKSEHGKQSKQQKKSKKGEKKQNSK